MSDLATPTFWNGLPTIAVRGTAVVDDDPAFPKYWAREDGDLIGHRIQVVCMNIDGVTTYLDNRAGYGWTKVTRGHGSPRFGHRSVSIVPDSFKEAFIPPMTCTNFNDGGDY